MRLLLVAAWVLAVLAMVLAIIPRTFLGATYEVWFLASFMTFLLDLLVGGHTTFAARAPRAPQ